METFVLSVLVGMGAFILGMTAMMLLGSAHDSETIADFEQAIAALEEKLQLLEELHGLDAEVVAVGPIQGTKVREFVQYQSWMYPGDRLVFVHSPLHIKEDDNEASAETVPMFLQKQAE